MARTPKRIRTKKGLRRCMSGKGPKGRGKCLAAYNRGKKRRRARRRRK